MFDEVLNATRSEEKVSTTGVTQENPELVLPSNSPDSHQTQRRTRPLGRQGKKRVTKIWAAAHKSWMVRCPLVLRDFSRSNKQAQIQ